eukprot:1160268-Pelagomonas_calceolata.AAC.8
MAYLGQAAKCRAKLAFGVHVSGARYWQSASALSGCAQGCRQVRGGTGVSRNGKLNQDNDQVSQDFKTFLQAYNTAELVVWTHSPCEEHVLCADQANAFSTMLACGGRILWAVSICQHP